MAAPPKWPQQHFLVDIGSRQASSELKPATAPRLVTQNPTSRNHRQLATEECDYNNLVARAAAGTTGAAPTRGRTNGPIAIRATLTQHRQDLTPPGQSACQLLEMLINPLLDCRIDADIGGQPGDEAGQLLGAGHQDNIAFTELL